MSKNSKDEKQKRKYRIKESALYILLYKILLKLQIYFKVLI